MQKYDPEKFMKDYNKYGINLEFYTEILILVIAVIAGLLSFLGVFMTYKQIEIYQNIVTAVYIIVILGLVFLFYINRKKKNRK